MDTEKSEEVPLTPTKTVITLSMATPNGMNPFREYDRIELVGPDQGEQWEQLRGLQTAIRKREGWGYWPPEGGVSHHYGADLLAHTLVAVEPNVPIEPDPPMSLPDGTAIRVTHIPVKTIHFRCPKCSQQFSWQMPRGAIDLKESIGTETTCHNCKTRIDISILYGKI